MSGDIDSFSVPTEIVEAARKIENWMKQNGHNRWELMGLCSRDHAYELKSLSDCGAVILANAKISGQPLSKSSLDAPNGYWLDVNVSGATTQEVWNNMLDVFCYACECRQKQQGLWPHMVHTDGGKITAKSP